MPFDEDDCNDWPASSINDWATSSIQKYLGGEFLNSLDKEELIPFVSKKNPEDEMSASQDTEDYVFLLPLKLYRKYKNIIPLKKICWWLASGYSYSNCNVRFVDTVGAVNYSYARWPYGVVPSLIINLQSFVQR